MYPPSGFPQQVPPPVRAGSRVLPGSNRDSSMYWVPAYRLRRGRPDRPGSSRLGRLPKPVIGGRFTLVYRAQRLSNSRCDSHISGDRAWPDLGAEAPRHPGKSPDLPASGYFPLSHGGRIRPPVTQNPVRECRRRNCRGDCRTRRLAWTACRRWEMPAFRQRQKCDRDWMLTRLEMGNAGETNRVLDSPAIR